MIRIQVSIGNFHGSSDSTQMRQNAVKAAAMNLSLQLTQAYLTARLASGVIQEETDSDTH